MAIDAELVITPEIAGGTLRAMEKDFDRSFARAADDARAQIARGVEDGARQGADAGARRLRAAFRDIGGAGGGGGGTATGARFAASSLVALSLAGLFKQIDDADTGAALISSLLGESTAKTQLATARAAGMSANEFAGFSTFLKSAGGMTEQQDINDIVFDINARVNEAIADGEGILEKFAPYQGADRVARVLASISQQAPDKQIFTLDELGFGGETGQQLLAALQTVSAGRDGRETYRELLRHMRAGDGEALTLEAKKAHEFTQAATAIDTDTKKSAIAAIGRDETAAFFDERQRETDALLMLVSKYEQNARDATDARAVLDITMSTIADTTRGTMDGVGALIGEVNALKTDINEAITDIKATIASSSIGRFFGG